jgi:hypothetical protein
LLEIIHTDLLVHFFFFGVAIPVSALQHSFPALSFEFKCMHKELANPMGTRGFSQG